MKLLQTVFFRSNLTKLNTSKRLFFRQKKNIIIRNALRMCHIYICILMMSFAMISVNVRAPIGELRPFSCSFRKQLSCARSARTSGFNLMGWMTQRQQDRTDDTQWRKRGGKNTFTFTPKRQFLFISPQYPHNVQTINYTQKMRI